MYMIDGLRIINLAERYTVRGDECDKVSIKWSLELNTERYSEREGAGGIKLN